MMKSLLISLLFLAFAAPTLFAQTITACTPLTTTTPNSVARQVASLNHRLDLSTEQTTAISCYLTNADVVQVGWPRRSLPIEAA
jgi:hypothetical protein